MASTVPGIDREKTVAAKLGIGLQTSDLSTLAAPTISLSPVSPGLKLGRLRRLETGQADRARDASPDNGDGFAATLAKAIAARKAANDRTSRTSATRQPRVEARAERESAVRDVVRQLKQLVDAARETKDGRPIASPKQAGQAIIQRDSTVDAATLRGVFERLSGTEVKQAAGEDPSLTPDAEVQALLQTVADAIAQAMSPEGELDEAALAAALIADPLVLAAAESLIAALQAQLVTAIQVALPAINAEGDSFAGGESSGGTNQAVVAAASPAVDAPASVEASTTPGGSVSSASVSSEVVALDAPSIDAVTTQATAASLSPALAEARVATNAAANVVAAAETIAVTVEASAPTEPTTAPLLTKAAPAPSTASEAAPEIASVQTAVASAASSAVPETASLASAVVEASTPITASGGEDAVVSDPTSGTANASVLTPVTSGQNGAQTSADGQSSDGDGDNATTAGTTSVQAARANGGATQAASQVSTADADGVATTQSGSTTQITTSTTGASNTSPSTSVGAAAPAQRAEAVTQTQGAQALTPDVELHEQVSPVIVRQARLMSVDGGHELTVRLNPDHLGPLHIRISLLEGALSVGLTTANAEAQRALENALPQLRGALVESGLRLDRLDVSQRDAGNGGNSGGQRGSANAGRGGGNQPGYAGNGSEGRQTNAGNGGPSFADVLLDQDGRAFGSPTRTSRWMGYRAYRRG